MKPCIAVNRAGKLAAALTFFLGSALFLAAQSNNNKKNNNAAPPPPPPKSAPARPAVATSGQHANGGAGNGATKGPGGAGPGRKGVGTTGGGGKGGLGTTGGGGKGGLGTTGGGGKGGLGTTGGGGKGGGGGAPVSYRTPYKSHTNERETNLPGGRKEFVNPTNGRKVVTDARGVPRRIESPHGLADKTVINRGPHGARIVETGRPGNRVVSYGGRRGFVERPIRPGYISRTYVYGGRSYAHVYREYNYRGVVYYHYVPAYYYGPRFYGWATTPWGAPVVYAWPGGFVAPWYGYYGAYFTPYPVYASPDLWLTDYLIAENLRLAYESQQAGNADQPQAADDNSQAAPASLSKDVKDQIAAEVRTQLAEERASAAQPQSQSPPSQQPAATPEQLPPAMNQKFFVVSSSLELTLKDGSTCSLTPGDVIQRRGKTVDSNGGVAAEVLSSKQGECPADADTSVQLTDLQDMHNQLREQLDSGLSVLAKNDAKGLPTGPASGARSVAEGTAEPLPGASEQLVSQESDASKLEEQVRQN